MELKSTELRQQMNDESPWFPGSVNFWQPTAHAKAGRGLGAVVELGHQHIGVVQSSSISGRGSDIRIS